METHNAELSLSPFVLNVFADGIHGTRLDIPGQALFRRDVNELPSHASTAAVLTVLSASPALAGTIDAAWRQASAPSCARTFRRGAPGHDAEA